MTKTLVEESRQDERFGRLQTAPVVGPIVNLAFVSWIDDPGRFPRSRDVGAYLGLRPRVRRSASSEYRGHITREGNSEMRRRLSQAAQEKTTEEP